MDTPSNTKVWDTRRRRKEQKLQSVQRNGKIINTEDTGFDARKITVTWQ